jgi:hypothetical protein
MDRQNKVKHKLHASTGRKNTLIQKKQINKTKKRRGNKNMITKNYIIQNIRIVNKYH